MTINWGIVTIIGAVFAYTNCVGISMTMQTDRRNDDIRILLAVLWPLSTGVLIGSWMMQGIMRWRKQRLARVALPTATARDRFPG